MAKSRKMVMPLMDLTGMQIGYWHINGPAPPRYDRVGKTVRMWDCTCRCGTRKSVRDSEIRRNGSLSCGCYNHEIISTHGETKTRLYEIWHSMKQRCYNPNSCSAYNYLDRGITVCPEWSESYEAFRDWSLAHGYKENLSIDRIDGNGNYCPENCRWVTPKQQSRNMRTNHLLTFNGETHPLSYWSELYGINYNTLSGRLRYGWTWTACP